MMAMRCMVVGLLAGLVIAPRAVALQAGAAKLEIDSPIGAPLDGIAERAGRGARQIHDPLYVRALYLEEGETSVCFVTADLFGLTHALHQRALELAPDEIPSDHIILSATNTHSGLGGMDETLLGRAVSGGFSRELLEETARRFGEVMRLAYDSRRRATVGYRMADASKLVQSWIEEDEDTTFDVDSTLGVLRVNDSDGNAIAIVANFSATPDTLGAENRLAFSADFPGAYCDALEEISDEGSVAMFWNGTFGGQRLGNPDGKEGWEATAATANHLAVQAKAISNEIRHGDGLLEVRNFEVALPPHIGGTMLPPVATLRQVSIDELLITFVPGAPYAEMGDALREVAKAVDFKSHFTVGASGVWLGHFPTASMYQAEAATMGKSQFGPYMSDWLVARVREMTLGELEERAPLGASPELEDFGGGRRIRLSGSPLEIGRQWGEVFGAEVTDHYASQLEELTADRSGVAFETPWKWLPRNVDRQPIVLASTEPFIRHDARNLSVPTLATVEGTAKATDLPFESAWLSQRPSDVSATLFAIGDSHTQFDGPLVGAILRAPTETSFVLSELHSDSAQALVQVGPTHQWAATVSMNAAGVVGILDSNSEQSLGLRLHDGVASENSLDALAERITTTTEEARALLGDSKTLRDVSLSSEGARTHEPALLLPGSHDEFSALSERIRALVLDEEGVAIAAITDAIAETFASIPLNESYAVVLFEPAARRYHAAFTVEDGTLANFKSDTLEKDAR